MSIFTKIVAWWEGTTIGQEIDAAAKAAIAELEALGTKDIELIAGETATAVLPELATGNIAGAIAAGVTQATVSFEKYGKQVSVATINTFATTIVNQAAANVTPVATSVVATPSA
jgi:hypothetical protein